MGCHVTHNSGESEEEKGSRRRRGQPEGPKSPADHLALSFLSQPLPARLSRQPWGPEVLKP